VALSHPQAVPAQDPRGEIETTRAALEASDLDDTQRGAALANLEAAASSHRSAAPLAERHEALIAEATRVPSELARLQATLEVDRTRTLADWEARLPDDADAETLELLLAGERADATDLRAQIDATSAELAKTLSRPAQSAEDLASLRRRIEETSTPPAQQAAEPALVFEARRLRRAAELQHAQAELALRTTERETAAARQRLLELQLREMRQQLATHESRIATLQRRISEIGRRTLARRVDRLAVQARTLATSDRPTATAAAENDLLGRELLEHNDQLGDERSTLGALERARERIQASLRESLTRLELGGASEEVGRWLWSERRYLESAARLRQKLAALRDALARVRLRALVVSEQQRALEDVGEAAEELRESAVADDDESGDVAAPDQTTLEAFLRQRADLLGLLTLLLQRRVSTLEQSERALQAQIDVTVELRQILDRRLLWIRSHPAVDVAWARRVPDGLHDLAKPSRLITTAELLARDVGARPSRYVASLLLLLLVLALRRRAPARIGALGTRTRQIREDRQRHTVEALAWTVAAALPGPVAMGLLGVLLQGIGTTGRFSDSLGRAVGALAPTLLAFTFLYWSCVEGGLAHAHFRWMRARREAIRRWVPRVAALVLPLALVVLLAFIRNQDLAIDVSARIAIVVVAGAGAWALWRLLDVGMLWVIRGATDQRSTARRILRVALPLILVAIAFLALAGYVYSAAILMFAALYTLGVVVVLAGLLGMLARWLLVGERRLKLRRLQEQRAADTKAGPDGGEAPREVEEDLSLEQVSAQTRRLLRAVRLTLLALGLVWVWADVIFAFGRLDEFALWHVADVGTDGSPIEAPVTLMAALLGVAALVLTVVGARNLPGLVELGLLSRTGVDAASRYAITSVLRYAIVAMGSVLGLGLLGLRWSQLQWMAAALSVGLGFGLQEIFANFVSGLILLFERPFRVGDVITIGDLSGRVTRIRTRATTILDFDNKEIVVPNKSFITDRLVNWTLSDTITRITIKVGVAYGTDPAAVRAVLHDAARENSRVLADPAPASWFLAFGASSLDFELRVFVGDLGDRLPVQDELNARIAALCTERGIEIAFPQLDLHVRDLPRTGDG
jgi:potassium efflux system protein